MAENASRRRRRHQLTDLAAEGLVWAAWFLLAAAFLLAACIALTLAWPSP